MEKTTRCLKFCLTVLARIGIYLIPPILQIIFVVIFNLPALIILNAIYTIIAYITGIRLVLQKELPKSDLNVPEALYASYTLGSALAVWFMVEFLSLAFGAEGKISPLILLVLIGPPGGIALGALSAYYYLRTEGDSVSTRLVKFFAMLTYGLFYLAPVTIEIAVNASSGQGSSAMQNTIFISALLQMGLGLWLGIHLTYQCFTSDTSKVEFWAHDIFSFAILKKSTYLLYSLPAWVACNLISSWVDGRWLPWWVHLSCYCPIFLFGLGAIIGYAVASTCGDAPIEEEQRLIA
jgi:hypothetical protein